MYTITGASALFCKYRSLVIMYQRVNNARLTGDNGILVTGMFWGHAELSCACAGSLAWQMSASMAEQWTGQSTRHSVVLGLKLNFPCMKNAFHVERSCLPVLAGLCTVSVNTFCLTRAPRVRWFHTKSRHTGL